MTGSSSSARFVTALAGNRDPLLWRLVADTDGLHRGLSRVMIAKELGLGFKV